MIPLFELCDKCNQCPKSDAICLTDVRDDYQRWVHVDCPQPLPTSFEYEYLFESEPNDAILIDGWLPVATERLRTDPEILIAKGKLRRIKQPSGMEMRDE